MNPKAVTHILVLSISNICKHKAGRHRIAGGQLHRGIASLVPKAVIRTGIAAGRMFLFIFVRKTEMARLMTVLARQAGIAHSNLE